MRTQIKIEQLHEYLEVNEEKQMMNSEKYDVLKSLVRLKENQIMGDHLFTISKMIMILCQELNTFSHTFHKDKEKQWSISFTTKNGKKMNQTYTELCDGLWNAITITCNENMEKTAR